jgi:hypothetical protein
MYQIGNRPMLPARSQASAVDPTVLDTLRQDLTVAHGALSLLRECAAVPPDLQPWIDVGLKRLRSANSQVVGIQRSVPRT